MEPLNRVIFFHEMVIDNTQEKFRQTFGLQTDQILIIPAKSCFEASNELIVFFFFDVVYSRVDCRVNVGSRNFQTFSG